MPRTKGAKGKKTLAKELGMTLEEYEEFIKSKIPSKIKLEEQENLPGQIILFDSAEIKTEENFNNTTDYKKEVINIESLEPAEEEIQSEDLNKLDLISRQQKIKKSRIECDRCHREVLCTPDKLNLTYLTGRASYHRKIMNERPVLCSECSFKLSELIDDFFYNNGIGVPLKFNLTELETFEPYEDEGGLGTYEKMD